MTFKEQTKHSKADHLAAIKEVGELMQSAVSCDPRVAAITQLTTAP